jgi:hypothetical protein
MDSDKHSDHPHPLLLLLQGRTFCHTHSHTHTHTHIYIYNRQFMGTWISVFAAAVLHCKIYDRTCKVKPKGSTMFFTLHIITLHCGLRLLQCFIFNFFYTVQLLFCYLSLDQDSLGKKWFSHLFEGGRKGSDCKRKLLKLYLYNNIIFNS